MWFKSAVLAGTLTSVLLWGSGAWAQRDEIPRVKVFVNDSAGVDPVVLRQGEQEAARLFRAAGIEIDWVNCAETTDCRRLPAGNEFILHIVANGKTPGDFVFGEAFLGEDGRGKYSDVFFDRINGAHADVGIGTLLGAVTAHELGHLLLGSHAHSAFGIMEPRWSAQGLRLIGMGAFVFTREQSRLMKERIGQDSIRQVRSLHRLPGEFQSLGQMCFVATMREQGYGFSDDTKAATAIMSSMLNLATWRRICSDKAPARAPD